MTVVNSGDLIPLLFLILKLGQIAQSVEQWTENPRVGSSILPLATIPQKNLDHFHDITSGFVVQRTGKFSYAYAEYFWEANKMNDEGHVSTQIEGHALLIEADRSAKMNGFTPTMFEALKTLYLS